MGLSANLAVQAIARVGRKRGSRARFYRPTSCAFDQRTLSLRGEAVSLSTTAGRLVIPMRLGNYQRGMLARAKSVQGGVLTKGPKGKKGSGTSTWFCEWKPQSPLVVGARWWGWTWGKRPSPPSPPGCSSPAAP